MDRTRSVLYLDFDNVFGGLLKLDPKVAIRFAEEPRVWLDGLRVSGGAVERRWLVLRCYMNPAGWVPHPEEDGGRLYFSRFRSHFTDAGFEVVDCPRLSHTKNGADIRLVIDAVDALQADVRYEEFVIASGDSDMTPLLVRLRASDRQVTLLLPADSAHALGAVADRLIGGEELLGLLEVDDPEVDLGSIGVGEPGEIELDEAEGWVTFGAFVRSQYDEAEEPLNLASLAHQVRWKVGQIAAQTKWFGHGGFTRAIEALDLPHAQLSQHLLWDTTRHDADTPTSDRPEAVARVGRVLGVPVLAAEQWVPLFEVLAEYAAGHDFNLTEATRWTRDRMAERGHRINRQVLGPIIRGAAYGGCPLYVKPSPSADQIGQAFVDNVLGRASAADVDLTPEEVADVRRWWGRPGDV